MWSILKKWSGKCKWPDRLNWFSLYFHRHQPWCSGGWHKAKLANFQAKACPSFSLLFVSEALHLYRHLTASWPSVLPLPLPINSLGWSNPSNCKLCFPKCLSIPFGLSHKCGFVLFCFPRGFYWTVLKSIRRTLPDQTKGSIQSGTVSVHTVANGIHPGKPQQDWAKSPFMLLLSDTYCSTVSLSHHGELPFSSSSSSNASNPKAA